MDNPDGRPSLKRRRLNDDSDTSPPITSPGPIIDEHIQTIQEKAPKTPHKKKLRKVLQEGTVTDSRSALAKTGVIYLSRIPPRLTPQKIRQLLTPFGSPVLRIFLAPESTEEYTRRTKAGGSKKRRFTEGWIEFEDKKVAKRVAESLNAERIGAKKGDFLYDDLWCLKYLPKFKWHHLTEQIAYQNASRAEKLRNEIAQEKRQNQAFARNAERSKMIENMQRKRADRGKETETTLNQGKIRRQFQQKEVVDSGRKGTEPRAVLNKLFE